MDPISTAIQFASTHRARLVRFEPLRDAGFAEHMVARQLGRMLHRLHADRTGRVSFLHRLLHRDTLAVHLEMREALRDGQDSK